MTSETAKAAKYLVCVDAREESRAALHLACMKAQEGGGAVEMLHVVTMPADFQTLGALAERTREERHAEGNALLKKLAQEANAYGITPTLLLREGQIGEEIIAAAQNDANINMIVIGISHHAPGRGTLSAWLAGQLGSKLLVPLLMVPGNLTHQQLQALV